MSYPPPPGSGENENPEQPSQPGTPPPPPYGAPPPPPPYGSAPPPPYGSPQPPYGAPQPPYQGAPYGAPGYPQAPYGNPYGPPQQGNQKALWSMILGIFGLLCCGIASVVALVLGHQAKQEIAASHGTQTGEGQAQAGWILGIIGCALWVLGIVVWVIVFASDGTTSY